ncbi:MAG: hypothetical protein LBE91_14755 [Tannerella sp.]|jgi:hypothetical protein|nr:hypothetical protein [Tannerella sp.]
MRNFYKFNAEHFGILLTPVRLRRPLFLALLGAMMKPVDGFRASFAAYVDNVVGENKGQVCQLERVLNDRFDPVQRRIYIENTDMPINTALLWRTAMDMPWYLPRADNPAEPVRLYRNGKMGDDGFDFYVVIPFPFVFGERDEIDFKNILNGNKIASKRYRLRIG